MKKNLINEDIGKMMNLIGYDRGKTLTENKEFNNKKLLNEQLMGPLQLLAAAGLGYLVAPTASAAVKAVGNIASKGLNIFTNKMTQMLGMEGGSPKAMVILNSSTWANLNKAFNDLEESFEAPKGFLRSKIKIQGDNAARAYAGTLYQAMDGVGTDEDAIASVYKSLKTLFDCVHVSAAYGTKEDENLIQWLKGDGELGNVSRMLKGKTYMIFDNKSYNSLEDVTIAMIKALQEKSTADELKQKEEEAVTNKTELKNKFKNFPCVVVEIENASEVVHPYKDNAEQVLIKLSNGDLMLVSTAGKYVAKVGGEKTSGQIECPDDFSIESEEELTLSESYIFEQNFGGIKLNPTKPADNVGGDEDKKTSSSGGGGSTRTAVTYEDVVAGKGDLKRGSRGDSVKKAQEALNKSDKVNPKLKVDGMFGGKTEAAIKQVGGDKVFNKSVIDMLGKPGDGVGGEEVTKDEENKLDKVTIEKEKVDPKTLKDQIADLEQAISQQPTKDECKDLIATAAAGIKKGVRLNDTSSLSQCYNSYNFGIGMSTRKVKKAYGLKGKGN